LQTDHLIIILLPINVTGLRATVFYLLTKYLLNGNIREFFLWEGVFKKGIPGGPTAKERQFSSHLSEDGSGVTS